MKISQIAGTTADAGTETGAGETASWSTGDSFIVAWERRDSKFAGDKRRKFYNAKMTMNRGKLSKRSHLAWPDKAGLVTAAVVAVCSTTICATLLMAAGSLFYVRLNHTLADWAVSAELTIVLPIWLLMRVIDFGVDGPAQRRGGR